MKIAVVTDSTSDLMPDLAERHNIEVVPNLLMIENQAYLDGAGITREQFYKNLPHYRHPTSTAAPSPEIYNEVYERQLSRGADVVLSLHPSQKLSALFDVTTLAAKSFEGKVKTIDGDSISLGLGFQALNAARSIAEGSSLDQVLRVIEHVRQRIRVFALFDTLVYAGRSGRVHWLTASLGSMLGLRAIVEIRHGVVHRLGLMRSRNQAIAGLRKAVLDAGRLEEAALLFTTPVSPADEEIFQADFTGLLHPLLHIPITPIIGSHVGPGCIGFALVTA